MDSIRDLRVDLVTLDRAFVDETVGGVSNPSLPLVPAEIVWNLGTNLMHGAVDAWTERDMGSQQAS